MWKVFLAFVTHRLFLLMVAALSLNAGLGPKDGSVWDHFLSRVAEGPEAVTVAALAPRPLSAVVSQTRNPFHWICVGLQHATGWRPLYCLLILSNLCLLLFLSELVALFNRMVTTDISTLGASLVVLWPTSYEMSLGSSMALAAFFLVLAVRHGLEQSWLPAGLAAAALALMDPIALALLPVFAYLFWGAQRFLPASHWGKNLAFFVVPFAVGVFLSGRSGADWSEVFGHSALLNMFQSGPAGQGFFSQTTSGQTVSLTFFFLGASGAVFSNVNPVHRFLPMAVLLALVLSSPYSALASRAPLAGICMEGIASASSGIASRIVKVLLLILGAYEVYNVFQL